MVSRPMINTTQGYPLPSPQQNTNFSLTVISVSNNVQVVSNSATMYVVYQGPTPLNYTQKFRWIPVGQSWDDTTPTELVNLLAVCTFNFGSYALCTVQSLS